MAFVFDSSFVNVQFSFAGDRVTALATSKGPYLRQHPKTAPVPRCSLSISRRQFAHLSLLSLLPLFPRPTNASPGLLIFPLRENLGNKYFLMRACETVSNAQHIVNSNPVNQLSLSMHSLTKKGVNQAMQASTALSKAGLASNAWIWPSVSTSSFETAEVLASRLRIRRENLVPEFSFLDARGVGALDGFKEDVVRRRLIENDEKDDRARPIAGQDGTPNDSAEDVFVRVRQLLSKLETQYFNENIVIISPDSDVLSILQAALLGEDLRQHHKFEFTPGEVRHVHELVADMFGERVQQPFTELIAKPA